MTPEVLEMRRITLASVSCIVGSSYDCNWIRNANSSLRCPNFMWNITLYCLIWASRVAGENKGDLMDTFFCWSCTFAVWVIIAGRVHNLSHRVQFLLGVNLLVIHLGKPATLNIPASAFQQASTGPSLSAYYSIGNVAPTLAFPMLAFPSIFNVVQHFSVALQCCKVSKLPALQWQKDKSLGVSWERGQCCSSGCRVWSADIFE